MKQLFAKFSLKTRSILAYIVVVFSFGFLFLLAKHEVPAGNKDVLNTAAGLILGTLATVVSYYFGSSKSQDDTTSSSSEVNTPSSTTTTTTTQPIS